MEPNMKVIHFDYQFAIDHQIKLNAMIAKYGNPPGQVMDSTRARGSSDESAMRWLHLSDSEYEELTNVLDELGFQLYHSLFEQGARVPRVILGKVITQQ
jgi:hypothetical protein